MALYTERHGMRKPIEHNYTITVEIYSMLLECCEKYYKYLTHLFFLKCHNEFTDKDYFVFNENQYQRRLKIKIPTLFRDEHGIINSPEVGDEYDQYALLDLIEYIAQNAKDISEGWNSQQYKNYWNIEFLNTSFIFVKYQHEINEIFVESGLLYTLTSENVIERVLEHSTFTPEVETVIASVKEKGLKDLLEEAVDLFRKPDPAARNDAVEKLWDALERLKTYYTTLNKKASITKIVDDMGGEQGALRQIFDDEFKKLTDVGNCYRIRHHETDKIDIGDVRHYDYLFNRCLALIATAIQYLQ